MEYQENQPTDLNWTFRYSVLKMCHLLLCSMDPLWPSRLRSALPGCACHSPNSLSPSHSMRTIPTRTGREARAMESLCNGLRWNIEISRTNQLSLTSSINPDDQCIWSIIIIIIIIIMIQSEKREKRHQKCMKTSSVSQRINRDTPPYRWSSHVLLTSAAATSVFPIKLPSGKLT